MLAGIFVGGPARRMGRAPKGLLRDEHGQTLVERWRRMLDDLGLTVALIGEHPAYADIALRRVADAPAGVGPIGGLAGLLEAAGGDHDHVLAFACDMPRVEVTDVRRLLEAPHGPAVLAARREDRWEPFCARYRVATCRPVVRARIAEGAYRMQRLLDALGTTEIALPPWHLDDWDRPEDLPPALRVQLSPDSSE